MMGSNHSTVDYDQESLSASSSDEVIRLLKLIYDRSPDAVICFDAGQRVAMANQSALEILGYPEEELVGRPVSALCDGDETWNRVREQCIDTSHSAPVEETLLNRDGRSLTMEIRISSISNRQGTIFCYQMVMRKIVSPGKTTRAFRLQRHIFRLMADNSYNWETWSLPNGPFMYVSPACERISGYTPKDFLENRNLFRDIIDQKDKAAWEQHVECNTPMAGRRELQLRIRHKNGQVRWIEHRCQAVLDDGNTLVGFRASNQDITIRKRYEKELHHSLARVEYFKSELAKETAHEEHVELPSNTFNDLVGKSNALEYIFFKIEQVAATDTTVLLLGETGTGKGLVARALHQASRRRDRNMITVDCASIPVSIIESQLFGHEKGSFTSAHAKQVGSFERAEGSTLFLDEIGDLPLEMQAKLLRFLQEREFERVGGKRTIKADVRIIAATNRDLESDVKNGLFRQDLWYRLNVFPITVPPLRDRSGDIPTLSQHFVERYAAKYERPVPMITKKVMSQLLDYPWPGNVRELKNVIEGAVLNAWGGKVRLLEPLKAPPFPLKTSFQTMAEMERDYIVKVLEETNWKVSGQGSAAEVLGMKRSTLRARMEKYNITKP